MRHYDPASGQLLTASYMDYTMPRADDLPSFKVSTSNTPCPGNPLGIKGCGEAGAIGSPPAVINAITDAIGINELTMPATPQKVGRRSAQSTDGQANGDSSGDRQHSIPEERGRCTPSTTIAPRSVAEAVKLAETGEAKFLSGGMTLIPAMKTRLAAPSDVVDITRIAGLAGREGVGRKTVTIGAATTHADVAASAELAAASVRRSAELARISATRMSVIWARSAARSPTTIRRPTIRRPCWRSTPPSSPTAARSRPTGFFTGLFETALEEGEMVTAVSFKRRRRPATRSSRNPASRYAMTGVFVVGGQDGVRAAVTGAGDGGVFRSSEVEAALAKRFEPAALDGVTVPSACLMGDIHASPEYRANLVVVMAKRAVAKAA